MRHDEFGEWLIETFQFERQKAGKYAGRVRIIEYSNVIKVTDIDEEYKKDKLVSLFQACKPTTENPEPLGLEMYQEGAVKYYELLLDALGQYANFCHFHPPK